MADVVAIYTRVSQSDVEQPASTRRQERACRRVAEARGWQVAGVWEDVDVSAYERGVRRPAFEKLLTVVAGGRVNGVLVWKLDRLVRRVPDFERFWTRCEQTGVFLSSATEPIDSTNELGLAVIRILVTFANVESTSISLRLRSRWDEKAKAGVPLVHGRVFGFNEEWTDIVESEATLIREAADRFLAGEALGAIVADWNRRAVRTARDGSWTIHKLSALLQSPRLVGDNSIRGVAVNQGCFPAIIDRLTAARVNARFADSRGRRHPPAKFLLSRLLRCALCGWSMTGVTNSFHEASGGRRTNRRYKCPSAPTGCGHTSIDAAFVEHLIVAATLNRLHQRSQIRPTTQTPDDASERLTAAFDRYGRSLRLLATDYYVTRRVTRDEWETARDGLDRQLAAARRLCDPRWQPAVVAKPKHPDRLRTDWGSLDLSHQRDVIASELEFATVGPASTRGGLDSGRITARWWESDPILSSDQWPVDDQPDLDIWNRDRWMGTREVAVALGIPMVSVTAMVQAGELPAVRLPRRYRYRRSDIEKAAERLANTIRTSEAAAILGVSQPRVADWIRKGKLPAVRRGGYHYLRPDDVRALRDRRRAAESAAKH